MPTPIILLQPYLAQAPAKPKPGNPPPDGLMMGGAGALVLLGLGLSAYCYFKLSQVAKKLRIEEFKTKDLQKKLKLALETIRKMETNPDLVHSREFNLDYLRMRMAEEVFHFAIVNQVKVKVKEKISMALRPTQAQQAAIGIATTSARQVDETFDVEYQTGDSPKSKKAILFRIQIRLMKLPTQATSVTINQIIDCIETFLSPSDENDNWQPTIQGRIVHMEWDQKAKPTPLLVLEQLNEGVNVSFATRRQVSAPSADLLPPTPPVPKRQPAASGNNQKSVPMNGQMANVANGKTMNNQNANGKKPVTNGQLPTKANQQLPLPNPSYPAPSRQNNNSGNQVKTAKKTAR